MPNLASVIDTVADVKFKVLGNNLMKHAVCLINVPRLHNYFYLFFYYFKLGLNYWEWLFFFFPLVEWSMHYFQEFPEYWDHQLKKIYPLKISHCSQISTFNQTLKEVKRYFSLDFLICFKNKDYLQRKTAIEKLDKVQVLIHSTSLWIFL